MDLVMRAAREQLRTVFQRADVGVTGANFAVAETGSICLVTNEGNADLVTGSTTGCNGISSPSDEMERGTLRLGPSTVAGGCGVAQNCPPFGFLLARKGAKCGTPKYWAEIGSPFPQTK